MMLTRSLILAKAPVAGLVKTRLIPAVGAAGAAHLARRMLEHTLLHALQANVGPVELYASPAITDARWRNVTLPASVTVSTQPDGDLGKRLDSGARRILQHGERVLLMGTDSPMLSFQHLQCTAAALEGHDAALLPTFDGGYLVLGLNRFHSSIFMEIPWSTSDVATITLQRMQALHWRIWVGETLADIDRPEDLVYLPPEWTLSDADRFR